MEELPALLGSLLAACLPSGYAPDTLCGRLYLMLETLPMRAPTHISSRFTRRRFVPAFRAICCRNPAVWRGLFELSAEKEGGSLSVHGADVDKTVFDASSSLYISAVSPPPSRLSGAPWDLWHSNQADAILQSQFIKASSFHLDFHLHYEPSFVKLKSSLQLHFHFNLHLHLNRIR